MSADPRLALPVASWPEELRARPVRNQAAKVERRGEDRLRLTVRRRQPWYFAPPFAWILHPRLTKTYELQGLGRQVWDWCDGSRSLATIVDSCAATCGLSFHEARLIVCDYVKYLVRLGLIVLVADGPRTTEAAR